MESQSSDWLTAVETWREGIRTDNWTIVGSKGVPPPAAAVERGWLVEAMEGDPDVPDFSCIARDESGQRWFISTLDGWCAVVPMPPRILTDQEKISRARMNDPDRP
jgi:hypothetical protein